MMKWLYLVGAALASDDWVSISSADAEEKWELTGEVAGSEPFNAKFTDLGFQLVDEFEAPKYVISQYDESKLTLVELGNLAYVTINRITKDGVDSRVKDSNLWAYYGGPALMRASETDGEFAVSAFKLAAALELEGISVQGELKWGCEVFKSDLNTLQKELKKERFFKWNPPSRKQTVSSIKELHEELVNNAFASFLPRECLPSLDENLVIAHRVYRQALTEAMGKKVGVFQLMVDRPQALSQLVGPLLKADPLALRLGKVNLRFTKESYRPGDEKSTFVSLGFLADISRQIVDSPDGLFGWCDGEFICLRESLGDDKLPLARAMGRVFALRTVEGLGWGMRFPKEYLTMLSKVPSNKFLAAIRQGFSEVVGIHHVGEFKELLGGPKETLSLDQLKANVYYDMRWNAKHEMVVELWKVVDSLDQVGLRKLIFMLTGSTCLGRQEMDIIDYIWIGIMDEPTPFLRARAFELRLQKAGPVEDLRSNLLAAIGV